MKYIYLDGILVVEGKEDKALLANFVKSPIVTINGLDYDFPMIEVLKKCCNYQRIIVLTDPDDAGEKIRQNLINRGLKIENAFILNNISVRGKKHGVAECDLNEITKALHPYICSSKEKVTIESKFLYQNNLLGYESKQNRKKICDFLNIPYVEGRKFKQALEALGVTEDKILDILIENGNK